jgi:hypothetical protein
MGNVNSRRTHLQNMHSPNWSYTFPLFLFEKRDLWRDRILEIFDLM